MGSALTPCHTWRPHDVFASRHKKSPGRSLAGLSVLLVPRPGVILSVTFEVLICQLLVHELLAIANHDTLVRAVDTLAGEVVEL